MPSGGTSRSNSTTNNNNNSNPKKSVTLDPTVVVHPAAPIVGSEDSKQPQASVTSPSPAADQHPYARGSVIEVWHIPPKEECHKQQEEAQEEWFWSSDDDNDKKETSSDKMIAASSDGRTIRLCDIIDRSTVVNDNTVVHRYYVHYRDFNRRMDEWITIDRIVSPPSVGNAKVRALKKQQKKLQQQQHTPNNNNNKKRKATASPAVTAEESSPASITPTTATITNAATETADAGTPTPMRSRRKSSQRYNNNMEIEAEAENKDETDAGTTAASTSTPTVVVAPADGGVTTTTTQDGRHVVATVNAVELDEHEGLDEQSLREHEEVTKVKNVNFCEMGRYQMETWYYSPLPKELIGPAGFIETLYVCEFTLQFFARKRELLRFQRRLPVRRRHPPGDEIYRKNNLAMFEVDAQQEEIYCQNLSYIAKLFLDHKTLYFSVNPFLFYVLCELDERGYHPVGYFSKEKYSDVGYNLACILTFPAHQRKGYGRFLIAFSYALSKKEGKVGSPEKPMSDLGQQAYKPYWTSTIVDFLLNKSDEPSMSVMDISKRTSIMAEDIVYTLNQLGLLKIINGVYFITAERGLLEGLAKKYPIKEPQVDPARLHWTPFLTDVKRDKFSIASKKASTDN